MQRSKKVGLVASIALVAVIAFSLLAGVSKVGATCVSPCWHHMSSPNVGLGDNLLTGVFAFGDSDVWAVGYDITTTQVAQTLIENYNGSSWSVVSSPNSGSSDYLGGVASARNSLTLPPVWAVGYYVDSSNNHNTMIEEYNNGSWSTVSGVSIGGELRGISGSATSNYWAVGYDITGTLTEHYDGSSWSQVSSPNPGTGNNYLTSVTTIDSTHAWAAGYSELNSVTYPILLFWNGTRWSDHTSDLPQPLVAGERLDGISFSGTSAGWAVGRNGSDQALAFNYGIDIVGGWREKDPYPGQHDDALSSVDFITSNEAWTVGGIVSLTSDYWDGTKWTHYTPASAFNSEFRGVSGVANTDEWAVGYYVDNNSNIATLIEHYN